MTRSAFQKLLLRSDILMVLSDQCAQISVLRRTAFDRRGSGHEAGPLGQRGRAEELLGRPINEVTFGIEVIVDVGVD